MCPLPKRSPPSPPTTVQLLGPVSKCVCVCFSAHIHAHAHAHLLSLVNTDARSLYSFRRMCACPNGFLHELSVKSHGNEDRDLHWRSVNGVHSTGKPGATIAKEPAKPQPTFANKCEFARWTMRRGVCPARSRCVVYAGSVRVRRALVCARE